MPVQKLWKPPKVGGWYTISKLHALISNIIMLRWGSKFIKSPFPKPFSLFNKIYRKGQLHCAHLCSGKFQSNGDCNAFSYDSKSQVCKLANLTFLEDPKPENSAQVKFKSWKAFKMYLVLTVELHAQHSALWQSSNDLSRWVSLLLTEHKQTLWWR